MVLQWYEQIWHIFDQSFRNCLLSHKENCSEVLSSVQECKGPSNYIELPNSIHNASIAKVFCEYVVLNYVIPLELLVLAKPAVVHLQYCRPRGKISWWCAMFFGRCMLQLGLSRDAEFHYERAMSCCRMNSIVKELSMLFLKHEKVLTAMDHADEDLNTIERDVGTYLIKAQLRRTRVNTDASTISTSHDHEACLQYYNRIVYLSKSHSYLTCNLAFCCFQCRELDVAFVHVTFALQHDFGQALLLMNAATVGFCSGDAPLAQRALKLSLSHEFRHLRTLRFSERGIMNSCHMPVTQHRETQISLAN